MCAEKKKRILLAQQETGRSGPAPSRSSELQPAWIHTAATTPAAGWRACMLAGLMPRPLRNQHGVKWQTPQLM
jgi:hypothetical protein